VWRREFEPRRDDSGGDETPPLSVDELCHGPPPAPAPSPIWPLPHDPPRAPGARACAERGHGGHDMESVCCTKRPVRRAGGLAAPLAGFLEYLPIRAATTVSFSSTGKPVPAAVSPITVEIAPHPTAQRHVRVRGKNGRWRVRVLTLRPSPSCLNLSSSLGGGTPKRAPRHHEEGRGRGRRRSLDRTGWVPMTTVPTAPVFSPSQPPFSLASWGGLRNGRALPTRGRNGSRRDPLKVVENGCWPPTWWATRTATCPQNPSATRLGRPRVRANPLTSCQ